MPELDETDREILQSVYNRGGKAKKKDIKEETGYSDRSLARWLNILVGQGYLKRVLNEEGTRLIYSLTAEGEDEVELKKRRDVVVFRAVGHKTIQHPKDSDARKDLKRDI